MWTTLSLSGTKIPLNNPGSASWSGSPQKSNPFFLVTCSLQLFQKITKIRRRLLSYFAAPETINGRDPVQCGNTGPCLFFSITFCCLAMPFQGRRSWGLGVLTPRKYVGKARVCFDPSPKMPHFFTQNLRRRNRGGGPGPPDFFVWWDQYDRGRLTFEKCRPVFELKVTPYFHN